MNWRYWIKEMKVIFSMMVFLLVPAELGRQSVYLFYSTNTLSINSGIWILLGLCGSIVFISAYILLFSRMKEFIGLRKAYKEKLEEDNVKNKKEAFKSLLKFMGQGIISSAKEAILNLVTPVALFLAISKGVLVLSITLGLPIPVQGIQKTLINVFSSVFYVVALFPILMRNFEEVPSLND